METAVKRDDDEQKGTDEGKEARLVEERPTVETEVDSDDDGKTMIIIDNNNFYHLPLNKRQRLGCSFLFSFNWNENKCLSLTTQLHQTRSKSIMNKVAYIKSAITTSRCCCCGCCC